jgi:hypothetical protein
MLNLDFYQSRFDAAVAAFGDLLLNCKKPAFCALPMIPVPQNLNVFSPF